MVNMPEHISPNTGDFLFTKKEIAKRIKVSPRTIDLWVAQGKIPKIKINSTSRFDWQEVKSALVSGDRKGVA